jgi:ABC-type amino acid transport substrate-binding protein
MFSNKSYSDPLKAVTSQWDKYTNTDGTGIYFELLNATLGASAFKYTIRPWKRAQTEFRNGKFDFLIGETENLPHCKYPQWPIDADFFSSFSLQKKFKKWPGTKNLGPLKVIWVRGYDLHLYAPELKAFEEVDNLEQGMKMIIAERADVLIDYDQDIKDRIIQMRINSKEVTVNSTDISGGLIYLCFQNKKHLASTIATFDKKMFEMDQLGKLRTLFLKYDREKNYLKLHNYMTSKAKR